MKALTIWQPWASLIIGGVKPYEFRSWPAPRAIRGERIAIHAGARPVRKSEIADLIMRLRSPEAWSTCLHMPEALPLLEEWHPSKRGLAAKTCPKCWASPMAVPRTNKLPTDGIGRVGENAKVRAGLAGKHHQVKMGGPVVFDTTFPAPFGFLLSGDAIVPYLISGKGELVQVFLGARILDPEFVRDDHLLRRNIAYFYDNRKD